MFDLPIDQSRNGLATAASPATVLRFPNLAFMPLDEDFETDLDPEPGTWPDLPDSSEIALRDILTQYDDLLQRHGSTGTYAVAGFGYNQETKEPLKKDLALQIPVGKPEIAIKQLLKWSKEKYRNPYFSLSTFKGVGKHFKGTEDQIEHVHGLCVDFDEPDAYKWKEKLPPGAKHQMVIQTCSLPYPRFQVFFFFTRPKLRQEVKAFATRLKLFTGGDNSQDDLSHVFRLPLWNWPNKKKLGEGRPPDAQLSIVLEHWNGDTIDFEDLVKALDRAMPIETVTESSDFPNQKLTAAEIRAAVKGLILDPEAMPNPRLLHYMQKDWGAEYDAIWDGELGNKYAHEIIDKKTKEKKWIPDTSKYQMNLANLAASLNWPPQEIMNLLIFHHREINHVIKDFEYYEITVGKAHIKYRDDRIDREAEHQRIRMEAGFPTNSEEDRRIALNFLFKQTGLPIERFEQHGIENPGYNLYITGAHGGCVDFPNGESLSSYQKFKNRIFDAGLSYKRVTCEGGWEACLKRLNMIREIVRFPNDTKPARIGSWIGHYLYSTLRKAPTLNREFDERVEEAKKLARKNNEPFSILDFRWSCRKDPIKIDGLWHINSASFTQFCNLNLHLPNKEGSMRKQLSTVGCKSFDLGVNDPNTTKIGEKAYWFKIPANLLPEFLDKCDEAIHPDDRDDDLS